jgi:hypothetical protein
MEEQGARARRRTVRARVLHRWLRRSLVRLPPMGRIRCAPLSYSASERRLIQARRRRAPEYALRVRPARGLPHSSSLGAQAGRARPCSWGTSFAGTLLSPLYIPVLTLSTSAHTNPRCRAAAQACWCHRSVPVRVWPAARLGVRDPPYDHVRAARRARAGVRPRARVL